ncbi:Stk1 family PASTA domain-containing Ser/Thr kinase [Sphaerisporangium sp. TRM90804]|uniref:Stk1 family PASTA domain-containing Ser/Thr kinase n=1 Tax=Sphaerisporangium sp. TRM90804 TaxID=3031113 RepID=UPI00244C3F2D|nr:Stk1 family PASTA domain-containing Ser/Thr kinase [Sphaerisporangium sp. TRM90804]MDH2428697.1 Stk1 family PASTA domain-containing Ser/Thr kinase [Sphaerisporangium sp. TRM90804]
MDTTVADPLVGRLLDGRYRVESRVARGGMAAVYLALDIRLDRTVALKVMHRNLAEDPDFVRRFIGEAKSVASLSHPNVVHVFDQGTDGEHVYLSMEYVPGRTLRDVLRERGRLPAREALEIVIPVLAALGAAHQAGMVHRDVKPENVLLTDDGRVKVVDFGLARAIEGGNHHTRTGVMIGTIAYMSPEQVTAGLADARSDVYAAGVMLFELLTGQQPYQAETPMSVAYRHVHDRVPAPSTLVPSTPPQLDTLVLCATDRDPAGRPADATALLVAAVDAHRTLPRDMGPEPPPGAMAPAPARPLRMPAADHTLVQSRTEMLTSPAAGTVAPAARRGFRVNWFIVALSLVMVAGMVASGWWFSEGRYSQVPDLLGMNVELAKSTAEKQGFTVKVGNAEHDDKVAEDRVLRTDPESGRDVVSGAVITLIPSSGPVKIAVPNVVNLAEAEARAKLSEAGLSAGAVSRVPSDTVQRGLVLRTDPQVGTKVRESSKVRLVLSAGQLMPDVGEMMCDQADAFLKQKGYAPTVVQQVDNAQPGTVIAQNPAARAEVTAGQAVQLTCSKGPDTGFKWPWERDDDGDGNVQPGQTLVPIPDVRFKRVQDAARELKAAGFQVRVRRIAGSGAVVAENPLGQAPAGTRITIWH